MFLKCIIILKKPMKYILKSKNINESLNFRVVRPDDLLFT